MFNRFRPKKTQIQRCIELLTANEWKWVSSYDIQRKCWTLHTTNLIRVMRKRGYLISHRIEQKQGRTKRGFYMCNGNVNV